MAESADSSSASLAKQMGLTPADIERRLRYVGFVQADAERVKALSAPILDHLDSLTSVFFDHIASFDEGAAVIRNRATLDQARRLKQAHLRAMVAGDIGPQYVEERLKLAVLYAQAGLEARLFLGAFEHLLKAIGAVVMGAGPQSDHRFEAFMSLTKIGFFDVCLIVDVLIFERERIIRVQQESLRELSTPVLQIRDRLLILPII